MKAWTVVASVLLTAISSLTGGESPSDLSGKWLLTSATVAGEIVPQDQIKGRHLVFDGNELQDQTDDGVAITRRKFEVKKKDGYTYLEFFAGKKLVAIGRYYRRGTRLTLVVAEPDTKYSLTPPSSKDNKFVVFDLEKE